MTKLIIQIPCFNEEDVLQATLNELPRTLPSIDIVEWMIIDDGSTDSTVEKAQSGGVDHIVSLVNHKGLAAAFHAGLRACIDLGADIIVNTDADNQYKADDIQKIVQPILNGRAEMVVGARPTSSIEHFSTMKKFLQKAGSAVIRLVSQTDIPDAPSGFRAFSRSAAMRIHVFSEYTYTLETIIQAGQKNMAITWTPVRVNRDLRPSRLVRSIPRYLFQSAVTAARIFITYRPLKFFFTIGAFFFLIGVLIGVRFLTFYFTVGGEGHVQSLIFAAILMIIGAQVFIAGILSDLLAVNRKLSEDIEMQLFEIREKIK